MGDLKKMTNEQLLQLAKDAIDDCFGDQSVGIEKAIENMEELQSDIEGKIDALNADLENQQNGGNDDE